MKTHFVLGCTFVVLFLVQFCAAFGPHRYPKCNLVNGALNDQQPGEPVNCEFESDYIVVGSGAAGSALMRKLSDDFSYSVLGFEAGTYKDDDPLVSNPFNNGLSYTNYPATYDWQMKTANVASLGKPLDISMGRMSGGSTSHNGMMYVKGSPAYLQQWSQVGGPTWSFDNIQDAYQRMENFWVAPQPGRGSGGLLDVKNSGPGPTSGNGAFVAKMTNWTSSYMGVPILSDYNAPTSAQHGPFYRFDLAITPDGLRESSSRAFLGDVMNPAGKGLGGRKLRLLWRCTVVRIIFDDHNRAKGVEYVYRGRTARAWAKKEVVLSSSIFSTQILQNSGVGDATRLSSMGIDVVYNNPNVGQHLANHPLIIFPFVIDPNDTPTTLLDPSGLSGGAFVPQWYSNGTYSPLEINGNRQYQVIWIIGGSNLALAMVLQISRSTGSELIQSSDPLQVPLHDEQMFSDHPEDLDNFASWSYNFLQQGLLPHIQSENPNYAAGWVHWDSVDDAKAYLVSQMSTAYHYSGTSRMAPSAATGVVDHNCRVFGVSKLRVADTSVIPWNMDGNTAAVSEMIGFRTAEFIIADRHHH